MEKGSTVPYIELKYSNKISTEYNNHNNQTNHIKEVFIIRFNL